jgi:hypothetical protein
VDFTGIFIDNRIDDSNLEADINDGMLFKIADVIKNNNFIETFTITLS